VRGEVVIVIGGAAPAEVDHTLLRERARALRQSGASARDVARRLMEEHGASRNVAYRLAHESEPQTTPNG
jgi:16S rRNA (cytidine1402-2'-O)-methyltransferase